MNQVELLQQAIQYLRGKGIVKKDKDISIQTGYAKTTVSGYVNGRTKLSKEFVAAFEKAFKVKLEDFQPGGHKEIIPVKDSSQLLTESVLQLTAYVRMNQSLLIEILAHSTGKTVMELERTVKTAMAEDLKHILNELRPEKP